MAKDLLDTLIERHFEAVNACTREHGFHRPRRATFFGIPVLADATMEPGSLKIVGARPIPGRPEPGGSR